MGKPRFKFSPDVLSFRGKDISLVSSRKGYFLLPLIEGDRVVGKTLFLSRESLFYIEHYWANVNKNWKYLIIDSYDEKTEINFCMDDTGEVAKLFKKMDKTKSPNQFLRYWFKVKDILNLSYQYIEDGSEDYYFVAL